MKFVGPGQAVAQAQGMASQMFEFQESRLEASFRDTYEAKLGSGSQRIPLCCAQGWTCEDAHEPDQAKA